MDTVQVFIKLDQMWFECVKIKSDMGVCKLYEAHGEEGL